MKSSSLETAKVAADAAAEKLGLDIIGLDVRGLTSLADIFLFVGASSHIHVRALEDGIREAVSKTDARLVRTDGQRGHLWRVLDFGALIVHIMEQKTREFYAVERLWVAGKKLALGQPDAPFPGKPEKKPKRKIKKKKRPAKKSASRPFSKRKSKPVKKKSRK